MTLVRTVALGALLLITSIRPADAGFSYGSFGFSGANTGSSINITIPQYDAATYGPLQSLQFAFTGVTNSAFSIAFENLASQAIRFGFLPYVGFDIKTTNFESIPLSPFPPSPPFPPTPTPTVPLAAFKGVQDFTGSDSITTQVGSGTGTITQTYSGFPGLSDFIGTGTVTFQLTGSLFIHETSTLTGSLPAYKYLTPGTIAANLTVTYNSAVPEPASLLLLLVGVGLAGMVVSIRSTPRRRSRSLIVS